MTRPHPLRLALLLVVATTGAFADETATRGVDVSHHSGDVDWPKVAGDGYTFAFAKASEGVDAPDPMFEQHWKQLANAAILRGAYHFYVTEDDPILQAKLFLAQIHLEPGDLAPVVDIEVIGKGTSDGLADRLRSFLAHVESATGTTPIIYTSARFWDAHLDDSFGRYPLWVAEYEVESPTLPRGWTRWTLWQYAGDVDVAGIAKSADTSRLHPDVTISEISVAAQRNPPKLRKSQR